MLAPSTLAFHYFQGRIFFRPGIVFSSAIYYFLPSNKYKKTSQTVRFAKTG